jgi:hypothetical protein
MNSNYISNRIQVTVADAVKELAEEGSRFAVTVPDPNNQFVFEVFWEKSNTQTEPTKKAITAKLTQMIEEHANAEYYRLRADEYPSIQNQLDTIFHEGLDAWKAQIQTVKDKYPKGTA